MNDPISAAKARQISLTVSDGCRVSAIDDSPNVGASVIASLRWSNRRTQMEGTRCASNPREINVRKSKLSSRMPLAIAAPGEMS